MKKYLACLLFIFPYYCMAQQIKTNEVDGFTKERTIHTSIVSLKSAYTTGMGLSLSSVGNHYLVNIVGYGNGIGVVRKTDFVYFLMDDGLILTATSIGDQPENEGGFTRVYQHHYLLRLKDVQDLQNKKVVLVRLTTPAGNMDIEVPKKIAKEIKKMGDIFLKEVAKNPPGV